MAAERDAATLMIDSGVGGLSVMALAHQRLPKENFMFYADAANAPYGDKTPEEIRAFFARQGFRILCECSLMPDAGESSIAETALCIREKALQL